MNPTARVRLSLGMLAVLSACTSGSSSSRAGQDTWQTIGQAQARPNVILIVTDDQGYGDLGAHGNSMISTPHLDQLAAESIELTDFHVDPTCSPTRSALLTGRYSTRTGVWHTIMGRSLMDPGEETLGELFQANGYRTGLFGKWHLGDNYPCRPVDQGFEHSTWHHGGGVGQGPDYWGNDYFDDTYDKAGAWQPLPGYCTDVWFGETMDFVDSDDPRPFFAYLATNAPHGPFLVAKHYEQKYLDLGVAPTMAKFYGMIENIDDNIGKLRAGLEQRGLADNTLLVFMTDNGTAAGHRPAAKETADWPGFNAGMRGHKGSEFDGGHRVPCMIHWPAAGIVGGRKLDTLAAHIDVLPTLVDLCQLNRSGQRPLDGQSLGSTLLDPSAPPAPDRTLFVHSQRIEQPRKWRKCAVMTERWRLVNGENLYDIVADPAQQRDIAQLHQPTVAALRDAYEQWWQSLSPVFDQKVRIGLGGAENPVELMSHDWHMESGSSPWHQSHVKRGILANGTWAVEVERAGEYEITLLRWPEQLQRPMNCQRAGVQIGVHSLATEIEPTDSEVNFRLRLEPGPAELRTTLQREGSGDEHGAYFASVRYIDD